MVDQHVPPSADPDRPARHAPSRGAPRGSGRWPAARRRAHDSDAQPDAPPRDPVETAREVCLRLLEARPRTRAELATALRRRGIPDDAAHAVLDRYDEVGLIDDAAFARAWVNTRHHGRGLARRALAQELRRKGVDSDVAGEALAELDPDTEEATARSLVERRLRAAGDVPPDLLFRRLVGMLARKGYQPGTAITVVRDALAARAEAAGYAEQIDPDGLADAYVDTES